MTVQEMYKQEAIAYGKNGNYHASVDALRMAHLPEDMYVFFLEKWARAAAKEGKYGEAIILAERAGADVLDRILQMEVVDE